jgi:hypothetical protein
LGEFISFPRCDACNWASDYARSRGVPDRVGSRDGLDAEAYLYVGFVACVGVEVVGGAAVELIALAKLAADEETECDCAEACGYPSDGLDEGRFFVFLFFREWKRFHIVSRDILFGSGFEDAEIGEESHVMDDSAR